MPQPAPVDLVALVGSRIAHDLISPLGAIGNGVELLELSGAADTPEVTLIAAAVENAKSRIRMFRIAFGAAAPDQTVAETEIRALLAPGVDNRKIAIDWQPAGDPPRSAAKLAFLALMCLETALPWGGDVQVTRSGAHWQIRARADRLAIDPALWALLADPGARAGIAPAMVHFALAGQTAQALQAALRTQIDDHTITLGFHAPGRG